MPSLVGSEMCIRDSAILLQLRVVPLTTGGCLHLVLFRAHCCCCELRAAGRAYSHLLLLVQKSKRHIPTYQKSTKFRRTQNTPARKMHLFSSRNPTYLLAAAINTKSDISGMPSMQHTEHPSTSPPGLRVSEHMPRRPSWVCLPECSFSRANATGALEA